MISKIELGSVEKKNNAPIYKGRKDVNFTGLTNWAIKGIQKCEQNPMINVAVLDLTTAILPRTFFETFIGSKQKDENGNEHRKLNIFGGFEALRRESSGLLINCIIPSFIVIGAAKLLNRPIMGMFNKSNLTTSWLNSEALDRIKKYYSISAEESQETKVFNTMKNLINDIEGVNGDITKGGLKKFKTIFDKDKQYEKELRSFAKNVVSKTPEDGYAQKLYKYLVSKTEISENIRFVGEDKFSTSNLKHICESAADMLHGIVKEGIKEESTLSKYLSKLNKLINAKSIAGLGIIIPLAIAAQPINRWITHKMSGRQGAPIYNDDNERKLTPNEQKKLTAEKFFAVPLMWAVAGLSMFLDRPSLKLFQFKNIFPTMDQARIISAATFSSRIAASEDSNELKENTIRDIATFSSFYFLGDYAAKAIATLIEKVKGITLINKLKETPKDANIFKKLWIWAKHTTIKSTDELEAISNTKLKTTSVNLRAICQLGNLAFSLLSLGIFIPLYTRTQTNKKKQREAEEKFEKLNKPSANFSKNLKSPAFSSFKLIQEKKA